MFVNGDSCYQNFSSVSHNNYGNSEAFMLQRILFLSSTDRKSSLVSYSPPILDDDVVGPFTVEYTLDEPQGLFGDFTVSDG